MAVKFKINCKNVYKTALSLDSYNKELDDIWKKMKTISSSINKTINSDSINKISLEFNDYIDSLNDVNMFLEKESQIMKTAAIKHGKIDTDLSDTFKGSGNIEK